MEKPMTESSRSKHSAVTGFFSPEPGATIASGGASAWCVGSRFGVPAMNVTYRLSDGQQVRFEAYCQAILGGLATGCVVSDPNNSKVNKYGCSASGYRKICIIVPGPGSGCTGGDVTFDVFRR
jgi:hypothetical protein